jgi:sulfofructose kinase
MTFAPRAAEACGLDLVGLGQNSVDQICLVERFPAAGSKTEALDYHVLPGGQVATAVLTAHRHGLRACYIGAVGGDDLGELALKVLREEGVDLRIKQVDGASTKSAMIIVDRSGERTIVDRCDPETTITAGDLDQGLIRSARVLHLDITDVAAAVQAARWAREAGTLVCLDLDRLLPGVEELLPLVDLLVASEGLPEQLGSPDPRLALHTLRGHCPDGLVCITRGERGCVALLGEEAFWVPAFHVNVVDTTGCGDVFRGALICAVLDGQQMLAALRYASAAAAIQAGTLGAQAGVPGRAQVRTFLDAAPRERSFDDR